MASSNPPRLVFLMDEASAELMLNEGSSSYDEIRLACLRLLLQCSKTCRNRFKWSYKFFNSHGPRLQKMNRFPFKPLNLESFEDFEGEITQRFGRVKNLHDAMIRVSKHQDYPIPSTSEATFIQDTSSNNEKCTPSEVLKIALTELLCEYDWDVPEICSPEQITTISRLRKNSNKITPILTNMIFILSPVPCSSDALLQFTGIKASKPNSCINPTTLLSLFMPQSLLDKYLNLARAKLFWIDVKNNSMKDSRELKSLSEALSALSGSVIPLHALSQSCVLMHCPSEGKETLFEALNVDYHQAQADDVASPLIPPSVVIDHYTRACKRHDDKICTSKTPVTLCAMNTKELLCHLYLCCMAKDEQSSGENAHKSTLKTVSSAINGGHKKTITQEVPWHQMVIIGCVSSSLFSHLKGCELACPYVCFPCCQPSDVAFFQEMIKQMMGQQVCLIVQCIGSQKHSDSLGLLRPVTSKTCIVHVLKTQDILTVERELAFSLSEMPSKRGRERKSVTQLADEAVDLLHKWEFVHDENTDAASLVCKTEAVPSFSNLLFEDWFVPSEMQFAQKPQEQRNEKVDRLAKKLREHYKRTAAVDKRESLESMEGSQKADSAAILRRRSSSASTASNVSKGSVGLAKNGLVMAKEYAHLMELPQNDSCDDANLISLLKNAYEGCLADGVGDGSIVSCAHAMVTAVSQYFKCRLGKDNDPDSVRSFVESNFILTKQEIGAKYNEGHQAKKIREYKLQSAIVLECALLEEKPIDEIAIASVVDKVVGYLRTISFVAGPEELHKFLTDTLKDNYGIMLRSIFQELGEELNISLFSDDDSKGSSGEDSDDGGSSLRSFSSNQPSSVLSMFSLPSNKSADRMNQIDSTLRMGRRNIARIPSLVGGGSQRQISVPKSMITRSRSIHMKDKLGSKNPKSDPKNKMQHKKEANDAKGEGSSRVRRQLLSSFSSCASSSNLISSSKKPKIKKYAPETPLSKQGLSPVALRLLQLNSDELLEKDMVGESPDKMVPSDFYGISRCSAAFNKKVARASSTDLSQRKSIRQIFSEVPKMSPSRLFAKLLRSPSMRARGSVTPRSKDAPSSQQQENILLNTSPSQNTRSKTGGNGIVSPRTPQQSASASKRLKRKATTTPSPKPGPSTGLSRASVKKLTPPQVGVNRTPPRTPQSLVRVKRRIMGTPSNCSPSAAEDSRQDNLKRIGRSLSSPSQNTRSKTGSFPDQFGNRISQRNLVQKARRSLMQSPSVQCTPSSKVIVKLDDLRSTLLGISLDQNEQGLKNDAPAMMTDLTIIPTSSSSSKLLNSGVRRNILASSDMCQDSENASGLKDVAGAGCSFWYSASDPMEYASKDRGSPSNVPKNSQYALDIGKELSNCPVDPCLSSPISVRKRKILDASPCRKETSDAYTNKSTPLKRRKNDISPLQEQVKMTPVHEACGSSPVIFTPPSALSLLHLTTSPMLSSPKHGSSRSKIGQFRSTSSQESKEGSPKSAPKPRRCRLMIRYQETDE